MKLQIALVAALAALTLSAAGATPAEASVRCSFNSATHVLEVDPYADPRIDLDFADGTVRRSGKRILVLGSNGQGREGIVCAGGRPTVRNTDTVDILQSGLAFSTLDLSGGPLAPGFTDEPDGSDEIEVRFGTDLGALGYGIVKGTDDRDDWRLTNGAPVSGLAGSGLGLSLDPTRPSEQDVTYDGLGTSIPVIEMGAGNDRFDAGGVVLPPRKLLMIVNGGPGADTLIGSPLSDAIQGGSGRDTIETGAGDDSVDARDQFPDRIDCGAGGRDRVEIGKGDTRVGCERVIRRRPHHPSALPGNDFF